MIRSDIWWIFFVAIFLNNKPKLGKNWRLLMITTNNSCINDLENKKFGNEKYRPMLVLAAIGIVLEGLDLW